jgi:hypothetical protein
MPTMDDTKGLESPTFTKGDKFVSFYANHVRYEPSVWDLRLLFGQSDVSSGEERVAQHAGVTLPWLQVKLMLYFLQFNLKIRELVDGEILVPQTIQQLISRPVREGLSDSVRNAPNFESVFEELTNLYETFVPTDPRQGR